MKGFIYKITNKVNGKSYIGQTRNTVEFRWRQHKNKKDGYALHAAIRKYGEENFEVETLEECDASMLDEREIYYIDKFNTFENGYNLSKGGDCIPKRSKKMYICVDDKYEEMKQMYLAGFSCTKIGQLYNIDRKIVARVLKSLGVNVKTHVHLKLNKQEQLEIVERYCNGESLNQIAKSYGCSLHEISRIFKENGGEKRKSLFEDEERMQKIIDKYIIEKLPVNQICEEEKLCGSVFKRILEMHKVNRRGKKKRFLDDEESRQEVISLYQSGLTINDVAEKFNVSAYPIKRILIENNIPRRRYNFSTSVRTRTDKAEG